MLSKHLLAVATTCLALASASPVKRCFGKTLAIYARGTDPNIQGPPTQNDPTPTDSELASIASEAVPGISVTALSYPAAGISNRDYYNESWGKGIDNLQGLIKYVVNHSCSGTKIILLGYSQGASVITGAVAGGMGRPPLSGKFLKAIHGGVAIADPSYVPGLNPLDKLSQNTANYGSFQDGNTQQTLNRLKGHVFRSLCENGDAYCANAGNSGVGIHEGEEGFWHDRAVRFLKNLNL